MTIREQDVFFQRLVRRSSGRETLYKNETNIISKFLIFQSNVWGTSVGYNKRWYIQNALARYFTLYQTNTYTINVILRYFDLADMIWHWKNKSRDTVDADYNDAAPVVVERSVHTSKISVPRNKPIYNVWFWSGFSEHRFRLIWAILALTFAIFWMRTYMAVPLRCIAYSFACCVTCFALLSWHGSTVAYSIPYNSCAVRAM